MLPYLDVRHQRHFGVTILGSLVLPPPQRLPEPPAQIIAIVMASINLVGGYVVTDRMLKMFKQ